MMMGGGESSSSTGMIIYGLNFNRIVILSLITSCTCDARSRPSSIMLVNLADHLVDIIPPSDAARQQILYYTYITVAFGLFVVCGIFFVILREYLRAVERHKLRSSLGYKYARGGDVDDDDGEDEEEDHTIRGSNSLMVSGTDDQFCGMYEPTDTMTHGVTAYRKVQGPSYWLEYYAASKQWQFKKESMRDNVAASDDQGNNRVEAFVSVPAKCLPEHTPVRKWFVWERVYTEWRARPCPEIVINVAPAQLPPQELISTRSVVVSGAYGRFADMINGLYEPTRELFGYVSSYRKADGTGPEIWLRFNVSGCEWVVATPYEPRLARCPVPAPCLPEYTPAHQWQVQDGHGRLENQPPVRVDIPPARDSPHKPALLSPTRPQAVSIGLTSPTKSIQTDIVQHVVHYIPVPSAEKPAPPVIDPPPTHNMATTTDDGFPEIKKMLRVKRNRKVVRTGPLPDVRGVHRGGLFGPSRSTVYPGVIDTPGWSGYGDPATLGTTGFGLGLDQPGAGVGADITTGAMPYSVPVGTRPLSTYSTLPGRTSPTHPHTTMHPIGELRRSPSPGRDGGAGSAGRAVVYVSDPSFTGAPYDQYGGYGPGNSPGFGEQGYYAPVMWPAPVHETMLTADVRAGEGKMQVRDNGVAEVGQYVVVGDPSPVHAQRSNNHDDTHGTTPGTGTGTGAGAGTANPTSQAVDRQEVRRVVGFGSILVDRPFDYHHPAGTPVRLYLCDPRQPLSPQHQHPPSVIGGPLRDPYQAAGPGAQSGYLASLSSFQSEPAVRGGQPGAADRVMRPGTGMGAGTGAGMGGGVGASGVPHSGRVRMTQLPDGRWAPQTAGVVYQGTTQSPAHDHSQGPGHASGPGQGQGLGLSAVPRMASLGRTELRAGEEMAPGRADSEELWSPSGKYRLVVTDQGGVLLLSGREVVWQSYPPSGLPPGPGGYRLACQSDGNVVLYKDAAPNADGHGAVWDAGTWTKPGRAVVLRVRDEGYVQVVDGAGKEVWRAPCAYGVGDMVEMLKSDASGSGTWLPAKIALVDREKGRYDVQCLNSGPWEHFVAPDRLRWMTTAPAPVAAAGSAPVATTKAAATAEVTATTKAATAAQPVVAASKGVPALAAEVKPAAAAQPVLASVTSKTAPAPAQAPAAVTVPAAVHVTTPLGAPPAGGGAVSGGGTGPGPQQQGQWV